MREKPMLLKLYETLDCLGALSQENHGYLSSLRKGYEGERCVDELFEELTCPHLYLTDRLLETSRQTFQLDSVLITGKGVFLYEIKNYRGEYTFEDNRIKYYKTGKTILKPSTQLERAETFFYMFQEEYGMKIPIVACVIFIHPEFTLYQMPPNQNILLPSLLNKHVRELNKISVPLHSEHIRLARLINERHISDSPLAKRPKYTYEELRKGATCLKCRSWNVKVIERSTHCLNCSFRERNGEVILRKLGEYQVLFPDKELKTDRIYEWCGKNYSKESVRRVLSQNFEEKGTGKGRYYV